MRAHVLVRVRVRVRVCVCTPHFVFSLTQARQRAPSGRLNVRLNGRPGSKRTRRDVLRLRFAGAYRAPKGRARCKGEFLAELDRKVLGRAVGARPGARPARA